VLVFSHGTNPLFETCTQRRFAVYLNTSCPVLGSASSIKLKDTLIITTIRFELHIRLEQPLLGHQKALLTPAAFARKQRI
jgi:hypothetical protein